MRVFLYSLLTLFIYSNPVNAAFSQLISKEVKFKESAATFYQDTIASLSFPIEFDNQVAFEQLAQQQGYSAEELEQQLQWLARVYLEPGIGVDNAIDHGTRIMERLETIADTPYDVAYLYMLKGRRAGRSKQDFQQAIADYKLALAQIEPSEDLKTILLLHAIHYQLGDVYRITLQKAPALIHLNQHRELAYQIRDDYLIAKAEATLGRFYSRDEQYAKALQHYTEAIRLAEGLDKPFLNAILSLRLARVYRDLKSWDEALEYAHKAAEGFKKTNKDNFLSSAMTVIAMVYGEQGLWNQAIDYYLNAQQIDVQGGNLTGQALNLHNLGEAYFNNQEPERAISMLIKANGLFLQKKSKHYLVYNDLLIAQVAASIQDWSMVNAYAAKAFILAREKKLSEQMIEALQYRSRALKELGDIEKALDALEQLLTLTKTLSHAPQEDPDYSPSVLAEQKLKLQLNQFQAIAKKQEQQSQQFRLGLILALLSTLLFAMVMFHQWRAKRKLSQRLNGINQALTLDPISKLSGYQGFIDSLTQQPLPEQLALLSLSDQYDMDMQLGAETYLDVTQALMHSLNDTLACNSYLIRPGLIALSMTNSLPHQVLLDKIRQRIDAQPLTQSSPMHLGSIKVPLLNNPDLKISPETYFNVLQMMVAGAKSLGNHKDIFVSITPLNFAPAAILSNPLYLHLEKGISRGLVKVDCNDNKALIRWPKWHGATDADQP